MIKRGREVTPGVFLISCEKKVSSKMANATRAYLGLSQAKRVGFLCVFPVSQNMWRLSSTWTLISPLPHLNPSLPPSFRLTISPYAVRNFTLSLYLCSEARML